MNTRRLLALLMLVLLAGASFASGAARASKQILITSRNQDHLLRLRRWRGQSIFCYFRAPAAAPRPGVLVRADGRRYFLPLSRRQRVFSRFKRSCFGLRPPTATPPVPTFAPVLVPTIIASYASLQAPVTVVFSAALPDSYEWRSADYVWNFGDGNSSYPAASGAETGKMINTSSDFGRTVSHRFSSPGLFHIELEVSLSDGRSGSVSLELQVLPFSGNTFYLRSGGNDSAGGGSDASAWASLGKLESAIASGTVQAGDRVLFRRGDIFSGRLSFNTVHGELSRPLALGAYGEGTPPILQEADASAFAVVIFGNMPSGTSIVLEDLHLRRALQPQNYVVASYYYGGSRFPHLVMRRCEVEKGFNGLYSFSAASLTLEEVLIHGAERQGLKADHAHVLVRDSEFRDNGTSATFDHNIYLTDTNHSLIEYSSIHHGSGGGITAHGMISDVTYRYNDIHDNDVGISVTGGYSTAEHFDRFSIISNSVHHNPNMGFYLNSLTKSIICNNVLHENGTHINLSSGAAEDSCSSDSLIANNTLYSGHSGLALSFPRADSSAAFYNNLISSGGNSAFTCQGITNPGAFVSDFNLCHAPTAIHPFLIGGFYKTFAEWQTGGYDADGLAGDPILADPPNDFTLALASPARARGKALAEASRNFAGEKRGSPPDLGAR